MIVFSILPNNLIVPVNVRSNLNFILRLINFGKISTGLTARIILTWYYEIEFIVNISPLTILFYSRNTVRKRSSILKYFLTLFTIHNEVSVNKSPSFITEFHGSKSVSKPCGIKNVIFLWLGRGAFRVHSFLTNSARMALSTARIITPTSAKMASHILANPRATSTRHASLMPMAKTMFS